MPFCDIAHVIKKQGQHIKGFSKQQIAEVSETYLAGVGAHVIASEKGYTFVESNNPEVELLDYMRGMNRQYFCTNCKAESLSPDDEPKAGLECPNCRQNTLQRRIAVDIDGNMKRIMERVANANKAIQNKEMVV
jgi:DNA-directed RNA polymerase subunit RPC12/RpoP